MFDQYAPVLPPGYFERPGMGSAPFGVPPQQPPPQQGPVAPPQGVGPQIQAGYTQPVNPYDSPIQMYIKRMIAERSQPQQGGGIAQFLASLNPSGLMGRAYYGAQGRRDDAWIRQMDVLKLMMSLRDMQQPKAPELQTYEAPGTDDKYGVYWDANSGQYVVPQIQGTENLPPPQPKFDEVSRFMKNYEGTAEVKRYGEALPIYQSLYETQGENSRASDLNFVYGFATILDPDSVVREGEMILVKDTATIPDWLKGEINRLNGGAALQPKTRANILKEARSRVTQYQNAAKKTYERYARQGQRYGFPVEDIETQFPELPEIDTKQFESEVPPVTGSAPTQQNAGAAPPLRSGRYRYDPQTKRFIPVE